MHYHDSADFDFAKTLAQAAPAQAEAYGAFNGTVFSAEDDVVSLKDRELMAIGVSVTTQCPYCLDVHVGNAKKAEATRDEVARAVFVASALRAGAGCTHGYLALKSYRQGAELAGFQEPSDVAFHRDLRKVGGGGVEAFQKFDAAVFDSDDEVLSLKVRELIAVAVAATTQCPYCISAHAGNAKSAGASEDEVTRAVLVAAALRAGAGYTHGLLAMKVYDEK